MENLEAFCRVISSSINLSFLKSVHDDANIIFSDQTTYMNSICVQCVCSALWCECTVRAGQLIILIYLHTKGKYLCGLHDT